MIVDPYLSIEEKISARQRWVLVMSYIYYHLDGSVVDDREYDRRSADLADMMDRPHGRTDYEEAFKDFDGSTGFDLLDKLGDDERERVESIARCVLSLYRAGEKIR